MVHAFSWITCDVCKGAFGRGSSECARCTVCREVKAVVRVVVVVSSSSGSSMYDADVERPSRLLFLWLLLQLLAFCLFPDPDTNHYLNHPLLADHTIFPLLLPKSPSIIEYLSEASPNRALSS